MIYRLRDLKRDVLEGTALVACLVMIYVWFGIIIPALMGIQS